MIVDVTFCSVDNEYPPFAKIEFTVGLLERIFELQEAVKKLNCNHVAEFDSNAEFLDSDDPETEWTGRSECLTLKVYDDSIMWDAYIKNSNVIIETAEIYMPVLREIHKVLKTHNKDLPLLLGELNTDEAKTVLEERLRA